MSYRLEPMRWWHIGALMPLEDALFGDDAWTEGIYWAELARPDSRHLVVALDGADMIVGYAGLAAFDDEAHVLTIGVRAAEQGSGLGSALLIDLIAEAERRGSPRVLLEVREDNAPAQRMYTRHGFVTIGRRRGYYQPSGTDALVMSRG